MAGFDTQAKRFSGMGLEAAEAPLLPKPDSSFGQSDRQHFLDLYSGIAADLPAVVTDVQTASHFKEVAYGEQHMRGHVHQRHERHHHGFARLLRALIGETGYAWR